MGKKSRLKKERRLNSIQPSESNVLNTNNSQEAPDADFTHRISKLKELFSRYSAEDVCVSLNISDLWLPNVSSTVKHHFAYGVLLSMSPHEFKEEVQLDSYEAYRDFLKKVYLTLPKFYMLEDYIPEPDWGEIKILSRGEFLRIFYGGSIERIYDFIEAFKLKYLTSKKTKTVAANNAEQDLHTVAKLQNLLISQIDKSVGKIDDISPGHIEIPSAKFWKQSKAALLNISLSFTDISCSPEIIVSLGKHEIPESESAFSDSLFSGASVPGILVRIGNKHFPISPRNAMGVVLEYWEDLTKGQTFEKEVLAENVGIFLGQRFLSRELIVGPFRLASLNKITDKSFAAVILAETKVYLLVILNDEDVEQLPKIEKDVLEIVSGTERWGLFHQSHHGVLQLNVSPEDLEIIVLVPAVSAQFSFITRPPDTKARICFLPDFVTIMDSLNNAKELESFWAFVDESNDKFGPMLGLTDIFASFRDSHSVLVDGAISPDMIVLDPHWGSNWRFDELVKFWSVAPNLFPNDANIAWKIEPKISGIQQLIAKGFPMLAQHVPVGTCTVFFSFEVDEDNVLDVENGKILELFVHCIADSLAQRNTLFSNSPMFNFRRIVTKCSANTDLLTSESDEDSDAKLAMPLFSSWRVISNVNGCLEVTVDINLSAVRTKLTDAVDASFEVDCLIDWLKELSKLINQDVDLEVMPKIYATKGYKPRFKLSREIRLIDVPDYAHPEVPAPVNYKLARKELALLFQKIGIEPGKYQLKDAKYLIDQVRDEARSLIHGRIATFDREAIIVFCIQQYDELIAHYSRESTRIKLSMSHEVDFDRPERLAELHDDFIQNARNYRYLLECCLSTKESGAEAVTTKVVVGLIAQVDWLLVLYGASDVLHNDIDVAGVVLDNSFVPEIFYSENRKDQEKIFGLELANARLGQGLNADDEVNFTESSNLDWDRLDKVFLKDVGFKFKHFTETLVVLSQWKRVRGETDLNFYYQASRQEIIKTVLTAMPGIPQIEIEKIIDFATLDPTQVRRLIGKSVDESDVPIWEYNKRGSRYTTKPLIPINELLNWGAGSVERAFRNWYYSISNGYLPADFPWPNVKKIVRDIKSSIEKKLEVKAHEICLNATPYAISGIDFKFRFPVEQFDDVGDYDVFAYWPENNVWVTIECKYNQPPYCLKDGRRLRERIFGIGDDHGQFSKIEGRRKFLGTNLDKLRSLLKWPSPLNTSPPTIHELYVSRDIYWWMRNPPYEVPTVFVRIDALKTWLNKHIKSL